jgi:hypothetical protein
MQILGHRSFTVLLILKKSIVLIVYFGSIPRWYTLTKSARIHCHTYSGNSSAGKNVPAYLLQYKDQDISIRLGSYKSFLVCTPYSNVKLIGYQFWCTRCAFQLFKSLQWCSGRKSWKSEKQIENCERANGIRTECHEIEPNPSKDRALHEGDNLSFWDEFIKFTFFLTVQFIFISSTEVLSYWAVETLRD